MSRSSQARGVQIFGRLIEKVRFASDSLLEGGGFEISVPRQFGFEASVGLSDRQQPVGLYLVPESDMRPRSTPRALPAETELGFVPLSTTFRFARTKTDRRSFVTKPERGV